MAVIAGALCVAGVLVLGPCLYLAALAALSWRKAPPGSEGPRGFGRRFDVIVPAHNEQRDIAGTVRQLQSLAYPRSLFRIIVVADNCEDGTAAAARAAGAEVWERSDPVRRGKGYALAWAFQLSGAETFADAIAVVDADTHVDPDLLVAFDRALSTGAEALQAEYCVANPGAGWRTRLMMLAFTLFHRVRSLGRERLGLSCGLRGNGMCFTAALLRRVPPRAFSVVEDLEYGIALGRAGVRVRFVEGARVFGAMAVTEKASRSQRRRWEHGRFVLARTLLPALLKEALQRRSLMLAELGLDLAIPPLAALAVIAAAGLAASLAVAWGTPPLAWCLAPWAGCAGALLVYLLRGCQLSGLGWGAVTALARAPLYVAWKAIVLAQDRERASTTWIRTPREGELG